MNRPFPLCVALALFGSACEPHIFTETTTSGGASSTASSSGGAGTTSTAAGGGDPTTTSTGEGGTGAATSTGEGGTGAATSTGEGGTGAATSTGEGGSGATTSTGEGGTGATTSTGEGGSGATTSTGEGGTGATTSSGTGGGDPGPCVEDDIPGPPTGGTMGPFPSKCHCKEEALSVLPVLAAAAKAVHDATGASCFTAMPVPATVPVGTWYWPCMYDGCDFQTGTNLDGWLCLDVTMPTPVHCRYSYTLGAAYASESVSGPTVSGAQDFEVAAEGNADGDAYTSVFSIRGVVDSTGELVLQPLFQHQPDE